MPRLDNTSELVIEWFGLDVDENDPAATNLVDLCLYCFRDNWSEFEELEIDHSPYEDEQYHCKACHCKLDKTDNYYNL